MTRFISSALLCGVLLSTLTGCGGSGSSSMLTTPTTTSTTTTINGKVVPLTTTASGLQYYDTTVGSGATPTKGRTVSVQYVGTLLDGTQFDASAAGNPLLFPVGVGQVIAGFDEGVSTMKVGGQRRLVIPAALGYGSASKTNIPANSTLVFDVQLLAAS